MEPEYKAEIDDAARHLIFLQRDRYGKTSSPVNEALTGKKVSENAKQDLKDGLALYNSENNIGLRNAWNIIQAEWKCCGVIAYTDWHEALKEKVVPDRCCQEHYQNCGRNSTNMFWTRGCFEKVEEWLDENKHLLGTIGMVILVVQLLGMAFSMTLFHHIHRTGKKYDA
ncbi:hypothetical protein CCH79_00013033 [Gambusia affinis]|uniref:Tetraspanin-9 n=1 Tax=Gambusia affinis TaxID=33528 RepID=A0A315WAR8_GAMAF|nr:hypothetical protein CCH79_00013033 [Gambusia affinis]